jgi:hypothetical protein
MYSLLGNDLVNKFQRKSTRTIGSSFLGNGSLNKPSQQWRGYFLRSACRGVIMGQ